MEIGQQTSEVEASNLDEPPLGGLTYIHEKDQNHKPGSTNVPLNLDRSHVADLAHALDVERTVALLATSLR
jgi:hypothetical protein